MAVYFLYIIFIYIYRICPGGGNKVNWMVENYDG